MENGIVTELQTRNNWLQKENALLRSLLDANKIPYAEAVAQLFETERTAAYEQDQGSRIRKFPINEQIAREFYKRFFGRTDVYALRCLKRNHKPEYYPQCVNFRKPGCLKNEGAFSGHGNPCQQCSKKMYKPVGIEPILNHLNGYRENCTDVMGVYPLFANGTCRFIVFDFDNHDKDADADGANTNDDWKREVEALWTICEKQGIDVLVERSRSGRGAHLWIFFEKPVAAVLARRFGFCLLDQGAEYVNLSSFQYYDRMLPMQDYLAQGHIGNLIALPLQGRALLKGNSAFVDKNWNAYEDQLGALFLHTQHRMSEADVAEKVRQWTGERIVTKGGTPWEKNTTFSQLDAPNGMHVVLADGVYVEMEGLKTGILNKIRCLAVFRNDEYFKKLASGRSVRGVTSSIYLGEDVEGYVHLPRGVQESLQAACAAAGISMQLDDKRMPGREIHVSFQGELRPEQQKAVQALRQHENGLLHAATSFGKTVVCAAMIAEHRVNTLILVASSALIGQWTDSLETFLRIDEPLPVYTTEKGHRKTRKQIIGLLEGQTDTLNGIVDIAMVGSFYKKGRFHPKIDEYGMVILDEAQHAANETTSRVLSRIKAKYVYGVTATPMRSDGKDPALPLLLGPIRYTFTAKEQAIMRGIGRYVRPRFTRSVAAKGAKERLEPYEAYEILLKDQNRNVQMIRDVQACVKEGRTPIILSRFKEHVYQLYEALKDSADHVFFLTGEQTKKENQQKLDEMKNVPDSESLILVAIDKLVGEGFDFPRLNTLIMGTPSSFQGVIEQFVGRLDRIYPGKQDVLVYDYVDCLIPFFEKMYTKRLKTYRIIGYQVCAEIPKLTADQPKSIFDMDNYWEPFIHDLLGAQKTILISSPVIARDQVYQMLDTVRERQEAGVKVTVITWTPDGYGIGKPEYWMDLQETMRAAGITVQLTETFCERYAIMDGETVWYGSLNFLGKPDAEDNLMRIRNREIARELLEMTFGNSSNDFEKLV